MTKGVRMTVLLGFLALALGALGAFQIQRALHHGDTAIGARALAAVGAASLAALAIVSVADRAWIAGAAAATVAIMLGTQLGGRVSKSSAAGVLVTLPEPAAPANTSLRRAA